MAEEKEGFFTGSDENEDISLSESELANILGDTVATETLPGVQADDIAAPSIDDIESSAAVPLADDDTPPAFDTSSVEAPSLEDASAERSIDAVEESSDDEKLTIDDAALDLSNLPDASDISLDIGGEETASVPADAPQKAEDGFFADSDDETISLSDGELENILADVKDGDVPVLGDSASDGTVVDISDEPELPAELPSLEPEPAPAPKARAASRPVSTDDIFAMDAGDEIIALSGDELNEILSDEEARREREDAVRERPETKEPDVVDIGGGIDDTIDEAAIQNDIDELSRKMGSIPDLPAIDEEPPAPQQKTAPKAERAPSRNPSDLSAPLGDDDIIKLQKEAQSSSNVLESMNFENEIMKEIGVDAPPMEAPPADELPIPEEELPVLTPAIEDAPPPKAEHARPSAGKRSTDFDGTITEDDLTGALKRFADESGLATTAKQQGTPMPMGEGVKELLVYFDDLLANLPEEKIKRFAESRYYDLYTSLLKKHGI